MVTDMKPILITFSIFLFVGAGSTNAIGSDLVNDCKKTACINVYTDNNQIIIEAKKGDSTVKKTIAQSPKKPVVKAKPTKKPLPFFLLPEPKKPVVKKPVVKKPVVKKPVVKKPSKPRVKKAVTKVNLSDRLTKLVPTAGVAYQPEFEPLVKVPVYFWCDLPELFQSRVEIIGEIIDVTLRPSYLWSFGDGSTLATTESGAAYPNGEIQHSYQKPGSYVVTLVTTWNGSFTHNAQVRAVTGKVVKISLAAINIVSAPTTFKG
jgi:hypothetical protein